VRLRALGISVVAVLMALGLVSAFVGVRPSPSGSGTLLLELSSKSGDSIGDTQIQVHTARGGWGAVAHLGNTVVPAAPKVVKAADAALAPGDYDGVRLAGADLSVSIRVTAGQVEPVLVTVAEGVPQAAFAGNQDYNVGLLGLQGRSLTCGRLPSLRVFG